MAGIDSASVRFAALGDPVTEGPGDPLPGGGRRGWAALPAARGFPVERMPSARTGGGRPTRPWEHPWWMATKGTGWMIDRGTDLVPYLATPAARGFWSAVGPARLRRRWCGPIRAARVPGRAIGCRP